MSLNQRICDTLFRGVCALGLAGVLALAHIPGSRAQEDRTPYRLAVGDTVSVAILGEERGWESRIDLDGALRLPGLGQLSAEGMTLDEVEATLKEQVESTRLYVSPRVSVAVSIYAPILVTGSVNNPGLFNYAPNLTIRSAASMAGGVSLIADTADTTTLQATQLAGELLRTETDIIQSLVRLARVEAQLKDQDQFDVDLQSHGSLINIDQDLYAHLLSRERAILAEERDGSEKILQLQKIELANVEKQIALLEERRRVQEDLIRLQEEERAAAEALDARGLRTRMDMARLERSDATLRAAMLDIDAAISAAQTRMADISSAMARAAIDRRLGFLRESAQERQALEQLVNSRQVTLQKSAIIGNPSLLAFSEQGLGKVEYTIQRRRDGEIATLAVTPDALVMPGDILIVSMSSDLSAVQTDDATRRELAAADAAR